jgi:general secretion pathway protein J
MTGRRRQAGFSLLELVVALAVFAVVALMALQALQGSLVTDRALRRVDARNSELTLALARLRLDLDSAVAMEFTQPSGQIQPPALVGEDGFALSVAGQGRFDGEPGSDFARVEWRLTGGRLTRKLWPSLIPARDTAAGPEIDVLTGVSGFTIESYDPAGGWQTGIPAPDDAKAAPALPMALRITLDTEFWGRIDLIGALP